MMLLSLLRLGCVILFSSSHIRPSKNVFFTLARMVAHAILLTLLLSAQIYYALSSLSISFTPSSVHFSDSISAPCNVLFSIVVPISSFFSSFNGRGPCAPYLDTPWRLLPAGLWLAPVSPPEAKIFHNNVETSTVDHDANFAEWWRRRAM